MFQSINPATGEKIATYDELTPTNLDQKLNLAARTYTKWRQTNLATRTQLLRTLGDVYEAQKNRLAAMATAEMGKTLTSSIAEVEKCVAAFRYYADHGPAMLETKGYNLLAGGHADLYWQPLGTILAVMPWNFPFWQAVRFLAPAIMAGNTGVLKHASLVQGVAGLMEDMMQEAGAPLGLFQNLAVPSNVVSRIIADKRVAAVTLTGSEGAGMKVAEEAGRQLKKVLLELGGSDPFIVMPSANLEKAVTQAVKARIQNTGQSCICGKRMIVHTAIYDTFLEKFSKALAAVKAGDPLKKETEMGPLSSLSQRDIVLKQLQKAQEKGAHLMGGQFLEGPGAFMTAGLLTDVPLKSEIAAEEIFGPIAMMFRATDVDDAIRIANAVPFGLGASLWTDNKEEEKAFIQNIEAGMLAVNQMLASAPDAPFGGIKRSGYGRELGPFGMHEFMNLKAVLRA